MEEANAKRSGDNDPAREFVRLLAQHERRLYGYVVSLVPNWHDADEIVQETKIRLWEQFAQYDRRRDFGAWACTIAYYLVLAHRKTVQRKQARFSQQFVDLMAAEATALADEVDDRHHALQQCLEILSTTNRQLIARCYQGNETIKEVAIQMGRPIAGTQKAVARIRHKLQACIESKLQQEGSL